MAKRRVPVGVRQNQRLERRLVQRGFAHTEGDATTLILCPCGAGATPIATPRRSEFLEGRWRMVCAYCDGAAM
jgi:hypothetical protein